ncbi:hypothetical protein [Nocardioides sp. T2.26MG-1]|uniref:hypothetical protein n=1 Tax=Nocardioides sp. T2.26MG-1 TaxID=3041166 RepID=UPI002477BC8B|nr:hypothetical protein [Nocardioides sp. T2.26MG-1]CAI9417404.1 hypothetical protein HIDPHFAB_03011 [Nocardioides sp. T2.26MG-1]
MGLREEALAAADAAKEQREAAARGVLAARLDPAPVDGLTVVDTDPRLVVFGDGAGLFLAVYDQGNPTRVTRVVGQPGDWTHRGDVASLTALGLILAAEAGA